MDSLKNYLTSLALLYAWTLFAAGMFALGEKICRDLFAQRQPAPFGANGPPPNPPRPDLARS
jgi:hypothetical protein